MLYEEGKFQLTDPLSKFFPAFADVKVLNGTTPTGGMLLDSPRRPITIQDVFRHTAGFTYGFFGGSPVDKMYQDANVFGTDLDGLMDEAGEDAAALPAGRTLGVQRRARRAGGAGREAVGAEIRRLRAAADLHAARHERLDVQDSGRQEVARAGSLRHGEGQAGGRHQPARRGRLRRPGVRRLQHLDHRGRLRALRADAAQQGPVEQRAAAEPEDGGVDGDESPAAGGARLDRHLRPGAEPATALACRC